MIGQQILIFPSSRFSFLPCLYSLLSLSIPSTIPAGRPPTYASDMPQQLAACSTSPLPPSMEMQAAVTFPIQASPSVLRCSTVRGEADLVLTPRRSSWRKSGNSPRQGRNQASTCLRSTSRQEYFPAHQMHRIPYWRRIRRRFTKYIMGTITITPCTAKRRKVYQRRRLGSAVQNGYPYRSGNTREEHDVHKRVQGCVENGSRYRT